MYLEGQPIDIGLKIGKEINYLVILFPSKAHKYHDVIFRKLYLFVNEIAFSDFVLRAWYTFFPNVTRHTCREGII